MSKSLEIAALAELAITRHSILVEVLDPEEDEGLCFSRLAALENAHNPGCKVYALEDLAFIESIMDLPSRLSSSVSTSSPKW